MISLYQDRERESLFAVRSTLIICVRCLFFCWCSFWNLNLNIFGGLDRVLFNRCASWMVCAFVWLTKRLWVWFWCLHILAAFGVDLSPLFLFLSLSLPALSSPIIFRAMGSTYIRFYAKNRLHSCAKRFNRSHTGVNTHAERAPKLLSKREWAHRKSLFVFVVVVVGWCVFISLSLLGDNVSASFALFLLFSTTKHAHTHHFLGSGFVDCSAAVQLGSASVWCLLLYTRLCMSANSIYFCRPKNLSSCSIRSSSLHTTVPALLRMYMLLVWMSVCVFVVVCSWCLKITPLALQAFGVGIAFYFQY